MTTGNHTPDDKAPTPTVQHVARGTVTFVMHVHCSTCDAVQRLEVIPRLQADKRGEVAIVGLVFPMGRGGSIVAPSLITCPACRARGERKIILPGGDL